MITQPLSAMIKSLCSCLPIVASAIVLLFHNEGPCHLDVVHAYHLANFTVYDPFQTKKCPQMSCLYGVTDTLPVLDILHRQEMKQP